MNLEFKVCSGKYFPDNLRVGITVRNYRANIAGYTESFKNRLVERHVPVLRPGERAINVKQNKPFHKASGYLHNRTGVGKSAGCVVVK
jgi:hypothetical protein